MTEHTQERKSGENPERLPLGELRPDDRGQDEVLEALEECLTRAAAAPHERRARSRGARSRCGHVGCCEQSPNKHATKHFHQTQDPLMQSFEPDEDWGWCYVDELFLEPAPLQKTLR